MVAGQALEDEWSARSDDVQAALGVERVGETEQVVLVGTTAVVEDEQAVGLARGRAFAVS